MFKTFTVTVTPKMTTYAGSSTFGEYTVEVVAADRTEALKKARADRRENEGRYAVPATFKARELKA